MNRYDELSVSMLSPVWAKVNVSSIGFLASAKTRCAMIIEDDDFWDN